MKVEGRNSVYEVLKTDKEIDKILVQKDLKDEASKRLINIIRSHKIKLQPVDKYVIEKESEINPFVANFIARVVEKREVFLRLGL